VNLAAALLGPGPALPRVVAFVGGGGKTTALFRLALDLRERGLRVLATSTTNLFDPRLEPGREDTAVLFRPEMEFFVPGCPELPATSALPLLVAREGDGPGKLKGIHPAWVDALAPAWDLVLVEADGSRRLPLKAPAPYEPVLPSSTDLVVGVLGLDGLGRPLGPGTVHRAERFARITGCQEGGTVSPEHLRALAEHPEGLFKEAPGPRVLLLNKADACPEPPSAEWMASLPADRVLLASLGTPAGVILALEGRRR
jgi:probable selenium-dependent hydroxylase accessory protein YqeC